MSSVETRQMLALEAGQMSDVETGQMPIVLRLDRCLHSVPTRQMSVVETGRDRKGCLLCCCDRTDVRCWDRTDICCCDFHN